MDREGTLARILSENSRYAETFAGSGLSPKPQGRVVVVACMDARLDVAPALGLEPGDAHIIRNAGGVATEDVIRSIILSQQLLGTVEIVVVGHTNCGLLGADEVALRERLADETGERLAISFGSFDDLEASIRASVARLRTHPWILRIPVHGLVYDVETGRLRQVV